ncbi:hypothetical protein BJF89_17640 [Corynebacterium sp. CNJ-954]|uniref:hypothetical protein n=1 Tax=Corynebacterium sp. CNJ-954 TaxID=1904962 RepID=UPI00096721C9|nr:hypothetical protein [Corynebacterium sp. CNJ-954]OLT53381.1 hypothetical protein BJF89_17640 [Corynebacterium sp. CNJ-954]
MSATICSATATAGVASPATTTVVTYGDSYTANPSQLVGMANQYEELKPFLTDYPRTGQLESGKECLQAPDNWPRLLQDEGMDVRDWSCTAQTPPWFAHPWQNDEIYIRWRAGDRGIHVGRALESPTLKPGPDCCMVTFR